MTDQAGQFPCGASLFARSPLALAWPPHLGVDPEWIYASELNLIDVAPGWPS